MTFEKSFQNFVQILSEEEVTPEISPSALADLSKEFFLRSIVAVVSDARDSDRPGEPETVISLFGPTPENEAPAYLFKHKIADKKVIVYNIYLLPDKNWNEEEYKNFSRIPVYKGEESDYITGYVLRQEILERLAEDKFDTKLGELARPILSFSEDEDVSTIWEKLLEKKEHISIIIDEYGTLRGIVTLEDVIETMLGFEIVDEKDEVVDMQELAKAQWKQMQKEQHK